MTAPVAVDTRLRASDESTGGSQDPVAAVAADFNLLSVKIEALVRARTRDPEAAADATQEAFLRLLREARAGRYPTHVHAWLYRTALNVVISGRRHAAVAERFAPALVRLDPPMPPDLLALERETAGSARAAIANLRPPARVAVVLAAQGVPGPEIAIRIGRSHAATRTLLCRARGQLRAALAPLDAA